MTDGLNYLLAGCGALAASLALTPLAIRLARLAGIVDLPNARKVHATPTPRTGGMAIAAATYAAAIPALLLAASFGPAGPDGSQVAALLASAGFVLLVGLADDVFTVASQWKLLALLAAAAALCSAGVRIDRLQLPGGLALELGWGAWPLTMLWVVAVTVAVNFIDGLDGLAAGLAAVACGTLALVCAAGGHVALAVVALALLGALAGFLVYNFEPAKLFMGDGGSMFLGFTVAGLSVAASGPVGSTGGLLLPALVLAVPLIDTVLTFVRRGVLQRRSIFAAERGHIHHRLLDLGLCARHAVLVLYAAALLAAVVGAAGFFGGRWTLVGGVSFLAIVLAGLFKVAGSVRGRETVKAVRRNRALGREDAGYRRAFEEAQLRFRRVESFDGWWGEVGAAADKLDCVAVTLPVTGRDGTGRVLKWRQKDSRFGGVQTLRATLPVRHRRVGGPLLADLEVPVHTTLECAGKRLALFARLMCEHSVAALPERPDAVRPPDARSPADAFEPEAEADAVEA
ncbi:MAG: tagO, partial [Phycisphaerales bacterium]|nr:tagO [Phycisphaerales bacterium]